MSRQAHPAARKLSSPLTDGDAAPDLRVLNLEHDNASGRPASSPEINFDTAALEQELAQLRTDNAELRSRVEQNEQLLHAAIASEEGWLERQREHELLLEEKSDVIRGLHQQIQELQKGDAGDNLTRAKEIQQLQAELEERRRQHEEDKEALMAQMRTMEMELSRDRADIARQRNEVQRLQTEVQREIEQASRDPLLHERLAGLRRRHQEIVNGKNGGQPLKSEAPADSSVPAPPNAQRPSGLLRRLFG